MTIVVLWYRKQLAELWCASDSRISAAGATRTDHGAKILPVPITCRSQQSSKRYSVHARLSVGFAFAGATLAALNTYAIASACTQNLASTGGVVKPPTVEAVAELFGRVADRCIRDVASRLPDPVRDGHTSYFTAFIFGFCKRSQSFKAFVLEPGIEDGKFRVAVAELPVVGDHCFPIGSGKDEFIRVNEELRASGKRFGVLPAISEVVARDGGHDVGGYVQVGVADTKGFEVRPILNTRPGALDRAVTFLGIDAAGLAPVDGYRIGYLAVAPDAP